MAEDSRTRLIIWPYQIFGGPQYHASTHLYISDDPGFFRTGAIGGSGFSSFETETTNTNKRPVNRGIVFGNKVFFVNCNRIRSHDFSYTTSSQLSTSPWVAEHDFGGVSASLGAAAFVGRHTGIYAMRRQGKPILACAYYSAVSGADTWRVATYEPTSMTAGTWASTNSVDIGVTCTQSEPKAEIVWRNRLYFIADSADGVARWNPDVNEWKIYPLSSVVGPYDFCPYKNKLWLCGRTTGGNINIYDVKPTHLRLALTLTGSGLATAEEHDGRSVMWTDGTFLHLMYMSPNAPNPGGAGFGHYVCSGDFDGNLSFIKDDTQNIAYSKTNTDGSTSEARTALFTYPSPTPDNQKLAYAFVHDARSATGTFKREHHWDYNESFANTSNWVDTGGLVNSLLEETTEVNTRDTGGERTHNDHTYQGLFCAPRIFPWWFSVAASGAGSFKVRTSFDVITNNAGGNGYEFPNGTKAAIAFCYNNEGHWPTKRVTLSDPSGGTLFQNNKLMSIVATSGTRYEVTLDFGSEGVYNATNLSVNPFIAITGVP